MATVVCPDAVHLKTSGVAAHRFSLFEHQGLGYPSSRKLVRSAYTGRTCS